MRTSEEFLLGETDFLLIRHEASSMAFTSMRSDNKQKAGRWCRGSKFSGPVALFQSHPLATFTISTASGAQLSSFHLVSDEDVVDFGWGSEDQLVIITRHGVVHVYDMHGGFLGDIWIGNAFKPTLLILVKSCQFWDDGAIVLTEDNRFICVEKIITSPSFSTTSAEIFQINTEVDYFKSPCKINSFCVFVMNINDKSTLKIVAATNDKRIIIIDKYYQKNISLQDTFQINDSVSLLATTPNNLFIACYLTNLHTVLVSSSDFDKIILQVDLSFSQTPSSLCWCGEDAVAVLIDTIGIVLIGPFGDIRVISFDTSNILHLICEVDACRVITTNGCALLSKKHKKNNEYLNQLITAYELFEQGDTTYMSNLSNIVQSNMLSSTIQVALDVAIHEYNISKQQTLLKAINFGRLYAKQDNYAYEMVDVLNTLRILNQMNTEQVGIFLTYNQLSALTVNELIMKLARRYLFPLSLKICNILHLKNDSVLNYWIKLKINKLLKANSSNNIIIDEVQNKLQNYHKISYKEILVHLLDLKRKDLVFSFLTFENNNHVHIDILLRMQEWKLAIDKCLEVKNTKLLSDTVIYICKNNRNYFNSPIQIQPLHAEVDCIVHAYYSTCGNINEAKKELYTTYITNSQDDVKIVSQFIKRLYCKEESEINIQMSDLDTIRRQISSDDRTTYLQVQLHEHAELLRIQKHLQEKSRLNFLNLSISQTLFKCYNEYLNDNLELLDWKTEINNFIKTFKLSDKIIYYLKIECFSRYNRFDLLKSLSNEKKSPIGYKAFAVSCIRYHRDIMEINHYIERISDLSERFALFIELGEWRKAAEVATLARDPDKLEEVWSMQYPSVCGRVCDVSVFKVSKKCVGDEELRHQIRDTLSRF